MAVAASLVLACEEPKPRMVPVVHFMATRFVDHGPEDLVVQHPDSAAQVTIIAAPAVFLVLARAQPKILGLQVMFTLIRVSGLTTLPSFTASLRVTSFCLR